MFEVTVQLANGKQKTFDDFDHAPFLGSVIHIGDMVYAEVIAIRRKPKASISSIPATVLQNRQNWE